MIAPKSPVGLGSYAALGLKVPAPRNTVPVAVPVPTAVPVARSRRSAIKETSTNTVPNAQASLPGSTTFEATRNSADRSSIPVSSVSMLRNTKHLQWSENHEREQLAAIARYVTDNYGLATYALDLIANYSVPVIPRGNTGDASWNKDTEDRFDDWMARADFTGRFDFETLQRLACFAIDTDGDVGTTMDLTNGLPQLRFWPCWRIGSKNFAPKPGSIGGVMIDSLDRVTGYEVTLNNEDRTIYSADEMLLLLEPTRYERYRGVSAMRQGLNDIRDVHDLKGFEKLAEKWDSAMPAVIKGFIPNAEDWEDPDNKPSVSSGSPTKGLTIAQLFGGDIPVIDGEIQALGNGRNSAGKLEFMDTLAGHFVAGLGLPPAFFLDAKLTGPNQRAAIGKAQKKFDRRKKLMMSLARWTWLRFVAWSIDTGQSRAVEGWDRPRFQCPAMFSIDLGDQAQNDRQAVASGSMSRQRYHGNSGGDWMDEEDQIFTEDDFIIRRCNEQAKATGTPVELLLARHGFGGQQGIVQPPQHQAQNEKKKTPNEPNA